MPANGAVRFWSARRCLLALSLAGCASGEPLEPCSAPPIVSTTGWRAIKTSVASFRIPPHYFDQGAAISREGTTLTYGTDSNIVQLRYGPYPVHSTRLAQCDAHIGGRRAILFTQITRRASSLSDPPRWFVTVYWGEIDRDRHLSLHASTQDSTEVAEVLAIVYSARLSETLWDSSSGEENRR